MALIKSISGIRGTIGGNPGEGLSPLDVVKFTAAYAQWARNAAGKDKIKVVVGRDARISGEMVQSLVVGTLMGMGVDVVNTGLAATPTVELAVPAEKADGGIILTASHNPKQWNALKLLNSKGEFLSGADGEEVLSIADAESFVFAEVDDLGMVEEKNYLDYHIQNVIDLDLIDVEAIRKAGLKVAVDAVNSVGGIAIPAMLRALGVEDVVEINCEPTGHFAHIPEPLPENLIEVSKEVREKGVDVCFVVDPDVDRLVVINEDGSMFGEEYTLVAVSDYVLTQTPGNTVSNLSSSRALRDVTNSCGQVYTSAAVGEVNVVEKMKATNAIIGGEGNGGVIYPASHYGRDSLVGVGLFLSHLAKSGKKWSELRAQYPNYSISKNKITLTPDIDVDRILQKVKEKYRNEEVTDIDGVRIDFENEWVHLRKSNTEPLIRVIAEAKTGEAAAQLAKSILEVIKELA